MKIIHIEGASIGHLHISIGPSRLGALLLLCKALQNTSFSDVHVQFMLFRKLFCGKLKTFLSFEGSSLVPPSLSRS